MMDGTRMFRTSEIFTPKLTYGKFDIFRLPDSAHIRIRLSWKHGNNIYLVDATLDEQEFLAAPELQKLSQVYSTLLEKRDARVEQVKYWTNCDVLE